MSPASVAVGAVRGSQRFSLHKTGSTGSIAPYLPTAMSPAVPLHGGVAYCYLSTTACALSAHWNQGFWMALQLK